MHELLLEAMLSPELLLTEYQRSLVRITGDAIAELDGFLARVDGKMQ